MKVKKPDSSRKVLLCTLLSLPVNNSSNHIDLAGIHPFWPCPNAKRLQQCVCVCPCMCVCVCVHERACWKLSVMVFRHV